MILRGRYWILNHFDINGIRVIKMQILIPINDDKMKELIEQKKKKGKQPFHSNFIMTKILLLLLIIKQNQMGSFISV